MNTASEANLNNRRCVCRGCGEFFNSTPAFDKHRANKGGFRCLTPAEMEAKGMAKNAGGWWVTALAPKDRTWNRADYHAPSDQTAAFGIGVVQG